MRWAPLVVLAACASPDATPDAGLPGTLDDTFGIRGVVAIAGGTATDLAVSGSDIIVYGANGTDLIVARISAVGVLEGSVVDLGIADPLGTPDGGMAVAADGQLVLPAFDRVVLSSPGGELDASFGSAGLVTPPDGETWHSALASGSDIVICGTLDNSSPQPLARRLHATGAVDATFGSAGSFTGDLGLGTVFGCRAQADGAIVMIGRQSTSAIVGRVLPEGSADPAFGSNGFEVVDAMSDARAVAIDSTGAIVVAGAVAGDFGIARLSAAGAVTSSLATPIGATPASAVAIAVTRDDRVLAAGTLTSPFDQSTVSSAVVRYTAAAVLDPSFGSGGIAQLGAGTRVFALTLAPDGKIVVAGDTTVGGARGLFVARLLP